MQAKACSACAKARRKCGKQKPCCLRCRSRGLSCEYAPDKPSSFVLLENQDQSSQISISRPSQIAPRLCPPRMAGQLESWWFASPETWTIDEPTSSYKALLANRYTSRDLDRILNRVVGWLAEWVEQGNNPFIHRQLYRHRFPRCIQDAYMSLSSYFHKTKSNEQLIFHIIEERVVQLVAQGFSTADFVSPNASSGVTAIDTLEHLARVQALLVYQCIGLYDGNIRLRKVAEQHIPVLENWMAQLAEHIRQTKGSGESLVVSPCDPIATLDSVPNEILLWYSWILAESTRRTWLLVAGVQGIYKLIQKDGTPCMGGTIFTTRQGFWEAPSALAWERRCSEVYAGMVRLTEMEKLFTMVPLDEINEFANLVLECAFGTEQLERWGMETGWVPKSLNPNSH